MHHIMVAEMHATPQARSSWEQRRSGASDLAGNGKNDVLAWPHGSDSGSSPQRRRRSRAAAAQARGKNNTTARFVSAATALAALSISPVLVSAGCPNACSNRGDCNVYSRCECWDGFAGADCSERQCPKGLAWSDDSIGIDTAHQEVECSNRGQCDRQHGLCTCMSGFTGNACQRLECANDCSGQGSCMSLYKYSHLYYDDDSVQYDYIDVWDAHKIYGCVCDYPYHGYDCSLVECPTGDDPLTGSQVNEIQLFKCAANGGSFSFFYKGITTGTISSTMIENQVEAAISAHPLLKEVDVQFSEPGPVCRTDKINVVSVEFLQNFGPLSPLVPYESDLSDGGAITVSADGATSIADSEGTQYTPTKGTKESNECSGRGMCDAASGVCSCYDTNGDTYESSDGYGAAGLRGDCGYATTVTSTCPGESACNGHGVCDDSGGTYACACSDGWVGGDCGQRACPYGDSWFSYPSADNTAHDESVECSDMGTCDRSTGLCNCDETFFGVACEYMACGGGTGNPCTGHGRCMSMAELALNAEDNGDPTEYTYGLDPNEVKPRRR